MTKAALFHPAEYFDDSDTSRMRTVVALVGFVALGYAVGILFFRYVVASFAEPIQVDTTPDTTHTMPPDHVCEDWENSWESDILDPSFCEVEESSTPASEILFSQAVDTSGIVFFGVFYSWLINSVLFYIAAATSGSASLLGELREISRRQRYTSDTRLDRIWDSGIKKTLRVVAWGMVPAVPAVFAFGMVSYLVLFGTEIPGDFESFVDHVTKTLRPFAVITGFGSLAWTGYIWIHGLSEVHDAHKGRIMAAVGVVLAITALVILI